MKLIPDKYDHNQAESKWVSAWEAQHTYRWDPAIPRANTFVVDTPPPTVSGSLHVGHVFSYTQTDLVVRYQRMCGKNIFYPMGWDDNGLATERRVQNFFGIRCDPRLPYDPNWNAEGHKRSDKDHFISRKNFIETCAYLTAIDEQAFERMWRKLGLSVDWKLTYATIDPHCCLTSQYSFLDLVKKGLCYQAVRPTMWDVDFRTAVAQAEVEDRERPGTFYDIRFGVDGGGEFVISTTRPELLAACIAVVAHPSDKRYQQLFGKTAITPLFYAPVPIQPSEHADPEKGSGIMMICTFGDIMDVEWWRGSGLPLKQVIGLDGKVLDPPYGRPPFVSTRPEVAHSNFREIVGLTIKQAHTKVIELLERDGSAVDGKQKALVGTPKSITHSVKFYEKGDRPLEFVPTRQWFIKLLDFKQQFIDQGRKINWYPDYMLNRFEHWVEGLNQDWCVSRQRYFGIPFPVWYPLKDDGSPDYLKPIYASPESLPVDPMSDLPPGYSADQRDKPGGFCGDPDVMDTWATSSLTPQIASHWAKGSDRHKLIFPSDIRPQAHDIIRTWAFYTIVKAWMHEESIPWSNILLSGWILDPDRKKMSKSKGNVVVPEDLIDEFSADAVRYWASRARLGTDTAFDKALFKIGRKLSTKLFNAARFVLMQFERIGAEPTAFKASEIQSALDCAFIQNLRNVVDTATSRFDQFDYASALASIEDLFWNFCDHYLELVKARSYLEADSAERRSAFATLALVLKTFLRLFAPFQPYITEEIWSWAFADKGRDSSIHTTAWPTLNEFQDISKPDHSATFEVAVEVIGKIRGSKTEAQKSLKWEVSTLELTCNDADKAALLPVLSDVLRAGNVRSDGVHFRPAAASDQNSGNGRFQIALTLSENWAPSGAAE